MFPITQCSISLDPICDPCISFLNYTFRLWLFSDLNFSIADSYSQLQMAVQDYYSGCFIVCDSVFVVVNRLVMPGFFHVCAVMYAMCLSAYLVVTIM